MSRYEHEHGTITIPTAEWKRLRESILTENNRLEERFFASMQAIHAWAKANRKRGESPKACIERCPAFEKLDCDASWRAARLLFSKAGNLQKPKRKDLKILPLTKSATLDFEDATVHLSNKNRTLTWHVDENNHACERAREHPMGIVVFACLNRVNFTRGSGGTIVGNDEYSRDDASVGGGGNYITSAYGPKGKEASQAQWRRW